MEGGRIAEIQSRLVMLLRHCRATVNEYLQTWKLKLSTSETVLAAFRLNYKEVKRELKVSTSITRPSPSALSVNTSE